MIEVNEETALLNDFTCPECGNVYELNDDPKISASFNEEIKKLGNYLNDLQIELKKEYEKIEGEKMKKHKKEDRKKARERAKKLEERRALRKIEKKKYEKIERITKRIKRKNKKLKRGKRKTKKSRRKK